MCLSLQYCTKPKRKINNLSEIPHSFPSFAGFMFVHFLFQNIAFKIIIKQVTWKAQVAANA